MARPASRSSMGVLAAFLFLACTSSVFGATPSDFLKAVADASIFSRTLQLISSSGIQPELIQKLSASNVTLFAPRDVWLEKNVNDAVLNYLLKPENVEDLKAVLLFHGTAQGLPAATLRATPSSEYTSFLGETLHIVYKPGGIRIEDWTPIKKPDAVVLDGSYVHGIDGLLIPKKSVLPHLIAAGVLPGAPAPAPGPWAPGPGSSAPTPGGWYPPPGSWPTPGPTTPPASPAYPPTYGSSLIASLNDGKHKKFVAALEAAGLLPQLTDIRDPVTVIAPTDKAFDALPQHVKDALSSDSPLLKEILLYHFISGKYPKKDLLMKAKSGKFLLPTFEGESATVSGSAKKLTIAGATAATIGASKSDKSYSILDADAVLVPPSLGSYITALGQGPVPAPAPSPYGPANSPGAALLDALRKDGKHKVLLAALGEAGLIPVIANEKGPLTLFAPTDDAFAAAGPGVTKALQIPELRDKILKYHAVPETVTIPTLAASTPDKVPTLEGSKISTSPYGSGVVLDGGAKLTPVDDSNAISTDTVLVPSDIKAQVDALGEAPAPAPTPAKKKKKSKKGVIIAAVVGSILGFLALLVCCWACFATYDKRKREDETGDRPVGAIEEPRIRRLRL